jgi:hypothetical protein
MEPNLHTDADKYQAGMGSWTKILAPLFIEFIDGQRRGSGIGCRLWYGFTYIHHR